MTFGGTPFGGGPFAGAGMVAADIPVDTATHLAVEVSFTTGALEPPAWVDITGDVRSWEVSRGRRRELERFQPGRATVVFSNLSRQYDSVNTAGPWFGNLKPMKRIRIRETFSGVTYPVFAGYIDKWHLDYPGTGKDATATVIATDGFKIFARTDLPKSVYAMEVEPDAPSVWWRLDDPQYLFEATDHSGNVNSGTPRGNVVFDQPGLIVGDPGGSVSFDEAAGVGITAPFAFDAAAVFSFEFWFKWEQQPATSSTLAEFRSAGGGFVDFQINPATNKCHLTWRRDDTTTFVADPSRVLVVGERYHIVCTHDSARRLHVFINGVEGAYDVQQTTAGALNIVTSAAGVAGASNTNRALLSQFAVYLSALSSARILAHYDAGTHPWQDDLPGQRIHRILDIVGWPADLREVDPGLTNLQSASFGE